MVALNDTMLSSLATQASPYIAPNTVPSRNTNIFAARLPYPAGIDAKEWDKKWRSVCDSFGKREGRDALPGLITSGCIRQRALERLQWEAEAPIREAVEEVRKILESREEDLKKALQKI